MVLSRMLTFSSLGGYGLPFPSHLLTASRSLDIPNQALMDISSAYNPALSYGADGILGLGFTSLSTIDALVNKTGSDAGRSLLYNAFAQNKSEPNFVAFALERSGDSDPDAISGSFAIGEYEPQWAKVADTSAIPTWPVVSPTRWNILLEALIVNQTITPVTTNVTGAPSNRAVALIDSGTSYRYPRSMYISVRRSDHSGQLRLGGLLSCHLRRYSWCQV
jgi:saccharopepsin